MQVAFGGPIQPERQMVILHTNTIATTLINQGFEIHSRYLELALHV